MAETHPKSLRCRPPFYKMSTVDDKIRPFAEELMRTGFPETLYQYGNQHFYVDGITLLQCAINGHVIIIKRNGTDVMVPRTNRDARIARRTVVEAQTNAMLKKVLLHYTFIPLTAELPVQMDLPPANKDMYFVPTAENVNTYIKAYCNVHYKGKTFAVNCGDEVLVHDQHPFCVWCTVKNGLELCEDDCYICYKMPDTVVTAREELFKSYAEELRLNPHLEKDFERIPSECEHQLAADYLSWNDRHLNVPNTVENTVHTSFCQPACFKPFFSTLRYYLQMREEMSVPDLERVRKLQLDAAVHDWRYNVEEIDRPMFEPSQFPVVVRTPQPRPLPRLNVASLSDALVMDSDDLTAEDVAACDAKLADIHKVEIPHAESNITSTGDKSTANVLPASKDVAENVKIVKPAETDTSAAGTSKLFSPKLEAALEQEDDDVIMQPSPKKSKGDDDDVFETDPPPPPPRTRNRKCKNKHLKLDKAATKDAVVISSGDNSPAHAATASPAKPTVTKVKSEKSAAPAKPSQNRCPPAVTSGSTSLGFWGSAVRMVQRFKQDRGWYFTPMHAVRGVTSMMRKLGGFTVECCRSRFALRPDDLEGLPEPVETNNFRVPIIADNEVQSKIDAQITNLMTAPPSRAAPSVFKLNIKKSVPAAYCDQPSSTLSIEPQLAHADKHGNYPHHWSRVFATHAEMSRLEALARILAKDSEMENKTVRATQVVRAQAIKHDGYDEPVIVTNGVLKEIGHKNERRQEIIPELLALLLIIRRRDNASRYYDTPDEILDCMQQPLNDSIPNLLQLS